MIRPDPKDNARLRYKIERRRDDEGNAVGWRLEELSSDGNRGVLLLDEKGVLTDYLRYAPDLKEEIHFDAAGEMTEWASWDYLPEDGLGWNDYRTEYDKNGNVIDSDWTGQA